MSQALTKEDAEKWWDSEKEECLELVLKGTPKLQIAKQLGVHRNTVNNWCSHVIFTAEARARMQEHRDRVQNRRTTEVSIFTDLSAKYALEAAKELEQNPKSHDARRTFREFAEEWRQNVREEREVLGTNVKRIGLEAHVTSEVTHEAGQSFKEALLERARTNVIDVETITAGATDDMQKVQQLTRKLLSADPTVLDAIHKSDTQAEQETEQAKKRRK